MSNICKFAMTSIWYHLLSACPVISRTEFCTWPVPSEDTCLDSFGKSSCTGERWRTFVLDLWLMCFFVKHFHQVVAILCMYLLLVGIQVPKVMRGNGLWKDNVWTNKKTKTRFYLVIFCPVSSFGMLEKCLCMCWLGRVIAVLFV